MKILTGLLLCPFLSFSQQKLKEKKFYNESMQEVDSVYSDYYAYSIPDSTNTGAKKISVYYRTGELQSSGIENPLKNDLWTTYWQNGKVKTETHYYEGKKKGKFAQYREDGSLQFTISDYKGDTLNGIRTFYFPNGQVRCIENFTNEIYISGKCFDEEGNSIPYYPVMQMPQFKGGMPEMAKFIMAKFEYPREALDNEKSGKVFVSFIVDETGRVTKPYINKGIDPLLDEAALKVIKLMPHWIPGKLEGKNVKVLMTVPIRMALK